MTMTKIDFLKKYCSLSNKRKLKTENKYYNSTIDFTPEHHWLDLKFSQSFKATYIYSKKYDHTLMWIVNRGLLNLCFDEMNEEGILIKIPGKLENEWYKEARFEPLFNYLYSEHEKAVKKSA